MSHRTAPRPASPARRALPLGLPTALRSALRPTLLALPLALALSACGGDSGGGGAVVTGVVPLPASLSLATGDEQPLAAVVLPDPGADQAVTWTSAGTGVARVVSDGGAWRVRAVAKGTTQLTVTSLQDPTRSAAVAVTVYQPPTLAFTASGAALLQAGGALSAQGTLADTGDRTATGVHLEVAYVSGGTGWLTAALAAAAPLDLAAGATVRLDVSASTSGLASGTHVALVEARADPGVLAGGNPFSVLLLVP